MLRFQTMSMPWEQWTAQQALETASNLDWLLRGLSVWPNNNNKREIDQWVNEWRVYCGGHTRAVQQFPSSTQPVQAFALAFLKFAASLCSSGCGPSPTSMRCLFSFALPFLLNYLPTLFAWLRSAATMFNFSFVSPNLLLLFKTVKKRMTYWGNEWPNPIRLSTSW